MKLYDLLKKIFPDYQFESPTSKPGLYIQDFPANHKIYIGDSVNVIREIRCSKTPFAINNNPVQKEFLNRNGLSNVKELSVVFPFTVNLKSVSVKREFEKKLMTQAGYYSINVQINPLAKKMKFAETTSVIEPVFKFRKGIWRDPSDQKGYQTIVPYKNLLTKSTEFYLYVFIHKVTGRFYIGQTVNLVERIRKHAAILLQVQSFAAKGHPISMEKAYGRIVSDMKDENNVFEYSIIEYLDNLNFKERMKRENEVRADAISRFQSRVYNNPSKRTQDIIQSLHRNVEPLLLSVKKEFLQKLLDAFFILLSWIMYGTIKLQKPLLH